MHALDWTVVLQRAEGIAGQGALPGTRPEAAWATELSLLALHAAVLLPQSVRQGSACSALWCLIGSVGPLEMATSRNDRALQGRRQIKALMPAAGVARMAGAVITASQQCST